MLFKNIVFVQHHKISEETIKGTKTTWVKMFD